MAPAPAPGGLDAGSAHARAMTTPTITDTAECGETGRGGRAIGVRPCGSESALLSMFAAVAQRR
jgi:hypothetical protein